MNSPYGGLESPDARPGDTVGAVVVDHGQRRTTIALRGEVDAGLEVDLAALCARVGLEGTEAEHVVVVDLGAVTFMDSSGIAFLVRLTQRVAPRRPRVLRAPEQVRFVLDVTGLATILDVE